MENNILSDKFNYNNIHFVGIGGISMSGLAEILLSKGYTVTGSDMKSSTITTKLSNMGAKVYLSHEKENVHNADLIVYTAAAKEDNIERIEAKRLNIPSIDRATLLGWLMKKYQYSIAISGTHGKTTTTSMTSMIMLESGVDPTIHIGGILTAIEGNTKIGNDKYFITEACEYYESFLQFNPYMAVILNIELDHVDYFRDLEHFKNAFYKFSCLVPKNGYVVACIDDDNIVDLLGKINCNKVTYGINSDNAMWNVKNIVYDNLGCASFIVTLNKEEMFEIKLNVPGIHNISNALAAIAASYTLGSEKTAIQNGLLKFTGTDKRFQLKGIINNIKVVDDYAHHPSEIRVTLEAAKNITQNKIWCVFQPHTYSRTKAFLDDFSKAFEMADEIILTDIYAAREKDTGEIHSSMLAEKLSQNKKKVLYLENFDDISDHLISNVSPGDIVITMGAGDICKAGEIYLEKLNAMI